MQVDGDQPGKVANMTIWFPRCVALLLLMLPFVRAGAVADGDTEVERLIKQLGSDEFDERETATRVKWLTRSGEHRQQGW